MRHAWRDKPSDIIAWESIISVIILHRGDDLSPLVPVTVLCFIFNLTG